MESRIPKSEGGGEFARAIKRGGGSVTREGVSGG